MPWGLQIMLVKCKKHFQHLLHLEVYGSNKVNEQFGGHQVGFVRVVGKHTQVCCKIKWHFPRSS